MKNHIHIPKNFELASQLSTLLNRILNMLTIDSIYLSSPQNNGEASYYFITAFVDASLDPIPNEIIILICNIEHEFPDFKIQLYTEASSEAALSRGSLYFVDHCCLGTKLFSHPEGQNILDYESLALQTLLKRADRYFNTEMQKVTGFVKAANKLITEKQYGIAAFNLHQAFELSFRFIEQMCLGRSTSTHSIISHVKYCKPYFSNLYPFSESSNLHSNELLILLEHAYNEARYGDGYQIDEKQIKMIQSELISFIETIKNLFQNHLDHCKIQIDGDSTEDIPDLRIEPTNESEKDIITENLIQENKINTKIDKLVHKKLYKSNPNSDESYYKTRFLTTGLTDILYDIAGIMKVCIVTLQYTDGYRNSLIPQPHINVQTALEHILQLLPFEELECLEDIINQRSLDPEKQEIKSS